MKEDIRTKNYQTEAYGGQALGYYDGRPSTPRLLQGGLSDKSGVKFENRLFLPATWT